MKLEFGLSVFSKKEILLGIQLTTHNGLMPESDGMYNEHVVELSIGICFAIFTIGFVCKGNKIDTPTMDNVQRAMKAFQSEMEKK